MIRRTGRLIGLLSLFQIVIGITVNFVLTTPLADASGSPGVVAGQAAAIGASALLGLTNGLLGIGVATLVLSIVPEKARAQAWLLVAVSTVVCAAGVVEQANVMSLVTLSQAYAVADSTARAAWPGVQVAAEGSRNWSHLAGLVIAGVNVLIYYSLLIRLRLLPRLLAVAGLVAGALEVLAVALPFFGQPVEFLLLLPMALVEMAVAGWLLARGFAGPPAVSP